MRFNFFPLVWSCLLLAVGPFLFTMLSKGSCLGKRAELERMGTIGSRKVWCGLRQILFHQRERKIYGIRTEYRGHSETAIYLCIDKKNGYDGHRSIDASTSIEDFPIQL